MSHPEWMLDQNLRTLSCDILHAFTFSEFAGLAYASRAVLEEILKEKPDTRLLHSKNQRQGLAR